MSIIPCVTLMVAYLWLAYAVPLDKPAQTPIAKASVNYRLPLNIKPINYKIILKPYLNEGEPKKFTFDGECVLEIQATNKTNEIQMHMKNLNISISQYYKKGSTVKTNLPNASPNNFTDIVVYNLKEELEANTPYILYFKYTGSMDDDMQGFYRCSYTTSKNVTKWLGATQFETIHARRAFPSFDEPKFKASFDLSLTRHRSLKSAGPTRIIEIKNEGEYVTDVYATTPIMSTYLLAFIVSELNDRSDGQFGVLARPEYYSQTEYSFDVGKHLLTALDNYLGIPYYSMGNDKMQLAAIPVFKSGAMENWGLLTFREGGLLYDENHSTLRSKEYIAVVVAHEQSHMWFGDLVTCDWWSYTWLNEGFATYFQYFAADMVESYFDMPRQFVVDQIQSVMRMDATNATNPMSDENTNTPSDFRHMFNSISYNKGASFIRMTKQILGADNFQKSLNDYLNTHKYNNTVPADLFNIWKKYWPVQHDKNADAYFASFTTQVGYPVITFNRTSDNTLKVSQKRFLLKDFDKADPKLSYTVPITYTTSAQKDFENTTPKFFLEKEPKTIAIDNATEWILGNIQETGYYRVNYDTKSWHQIRHALYGSNWSGIHELNRAQIVDDLLNFARAGEIDYSLAFTILEYLETETNYLPWASALNAFSFLNIRLGTDTNDFGRYILHLTNKAYNNLGFEERNNDTALDIYARTRILGWACKFGHSGCIEKAKSYFNQNLKADPVPVNIRYLVYCTALREGDEHDFNKLYLKFKSETVATEKTLLLNTMRCVRCRKLVTKFFHMIMSPEIRRQDKSSALYGLYAENNENVDLVFELVDKNIEELAKALGGYYSVATAVFYITDRFTTEFQLQNLKQFNDRHMNKFGNSASILQDAVKGVEFNLDWSNSKLCSLKAFLYEPMKATPPLAPSQ